MFGHQFTSYKRDGLINFQINQTTFVTAKAISTSEPNAKADIERGNDEKF